MHTVYLGLSRVHMNYMCHLGAVPMPVPIEKRVERNRKTVRIGARVLRHSPRPAPIANKTVVNFVNSICYNKLEELSV